VCTWRTRPRWNRSSSRGVRGAVTPRSCSKCHRRSLSVPGDRGSASSSRKRIWKRLIRAFRSGAKQARNTHRGSAPGKVAVAAHDASPVLFDGARHERTGRSPSAPHRCPSERLRERAGDDVVRPRRQQCAVGAQWETTGRISARMRPSPARSLGKPVICGTRIPVELILRKLGEGASEADLLDAYPRLTRGTFRLPSATRMQSREHAGHRRLHLATMAL